MLVVVAAQHYASQLVLANSQRGGSVRTRSHRGIARKAFERVTEKLLPASHVRLQRALAAQASSYSAKGSEMDERRRGSRASDGIGEDGQLDANVGRDDDGV